MTAEILAICRGAFEKQFGQRRVPEHSCFSDYTESPTVVELKGIRKFRLNLIPETPDAKVLMSRSDVVQQNYSTLTYFWQPCVKVMLYSLIGVQAIDMQKIDRFVGELR